MEARLSLIMEIRTGSKPLGYGTGKKACSQGHIKLFLDTFLVDLIIVAIVVIFK